MSKPVEEHPGVHQRLIASEAVQSLLAEQRAANVLSCLHWRVQHGQLYTDPKSGKTREVDLWASSLWSRRSTAGRQYARINLYVEAKTLKNYLLVFTPVATPDQGISCQDDWIGYRDEPIEALLREVGVSDDHIAASARRFERIAFPRRFMRIRAMRVGPPDCGPVCSAFRETNIGNERELDSSVLWKALQSVASAIEADEIRQRAEDKDELRVAVAASNARKGRCVRFRPTEATS
jgi:hypothetical protein